MTKTTFINKAFETDKYNGGQRGKRKIMITTCPHQWGYEIESFCMGTETKNREIALTGRGGCVVCWNRKSGANFHEA